MKEYVSSPVLVGDGAARLCSNGNATPPTVHALGRFVGGSTIDTVVGIPGTIGDAELQSTLLAMSWPQFRGAVENLGLEDSSGEAGEDTSLPLHQRVRFGLERLGHVEFDTEECENGWRVVPPALALCQHDAVVTAVLCGARSLPLLKRIETSAGGMQIDQIPFPDCPDIIRIESANAQDLEELGRREGLLGEPDAPEALLSGLPPVSHVKKWPRQALPAGGKDWEVKQLIIERRNIKWRTVTPKEANAPDAEGLFRFSRFQTPEYFLREGRETIKLPGAIGKYLILFRYKRRVLRYNRQDRSLSVPALFLAAATHRKGFDPLFWNASFT